jgi:hypothetical protein
MQLEAVPEPIFDCFIYFWVISEEYGEMIQGTESGCSETDAAIWVQGEFKKGFRVYTRDFTIGKCGSIF